MTSICMVLELKSIFIATFAGNVYGQLSQPFVQDNQSKPNFH